MRVIKLKQNCVCVCHSRDYASSFFFCHRDETVKTTAKKNAKF